MFFTTLLQRFCLKLYPILNSLLEKCSKDRFKTFKLHPQITFPTCKNLQNSKTVKLILPLNVLDCLRVLKTRGGSYSL